MVSRYAGPRVVNERLSQQGECFWELRGNRRRRSAVFLCKCGQRFVADHQNVVIGKTASCGCRKREADVSNRLTHGATSRVKNGTHIRTKAYTVWGKMIQRCCNPNNPKFPVYGGRGIEVCDKWKSFEGFIEDMGSPPDGLSIDRIDVNGGYCKSNCRWATAKEQANNRTDNVLVDLDGKQMTLKQAAEKAGVRYKLFWKYVRVKKMSVADAIDRCKAI